VGEGTCEYSMPPVCPILLLLCVCVAVVGNEEQVCANCSGTLEKKSQKSKGDAPFATPNEITG